MTRVRRLGTGPHACPSTPGGRSVSFPISGLKLHNPAARFATFHWRSDDPVLHILRGRFRCRSASGAQSILHAAMRAEVSESLGRRTYEGRRTHEARRKYERAGTARDGCRKRRRERTLTCGNGALEVTIAKITGPKASSCLPFVRTHPRIRNRGPRGRDPVIHRRPHSNGSAFLTTKKKSLLGFSAFGTEVPGASQVRSTRGTTSSREDERMQVSSAR
jgi:hypothetical protein